MVRTAASAVRVSAGTSSKKAGGSTPSASSLVGNRAKSGNGSSKLPPIVHQEIPVWQKPITRFFKSDPIKSNVAVSDSNCNEDLKSAGPSNNLQKPNKISTTDENCQENKENKDENKGRNQKCEEMKGNKKKDEN
ncbi:uncharacterized protein LOC132705808 [Cylas formicarius]|uniref:uncharacterized protein LOC132705808 n=1 Tax=Cylas formicarius TaxID=197179 RepID=UPI002958A82E|nr:uncharacterized protein LOC132705808 [Cylas formicarius]